jgi:peptide/nickel transport system substrate-binding protein
VVNSANPAYGQIAAIVAADLKRLGVVVTVAPLEFRSFVDRVMKQRDFDLAVMPLRSSNADPMADMNVLMSSGSLHLWNLGPGAQRTAWEQEIDRLMQAQAEKTDTATRKKLFDRVQEILAEQTPLTPLVSPHTIVAVRKGLANFQPSVLSNAALWNAEEIFWTESVASR